MTFRPSERVSSVPPSGIRRFFELAEEMVQVMPNAILHEQTILQHFSDPASMGRIYSEFLQSL